MGPLATLREARLEDVYYLAKLSTQLGYPASPEDIARRLHEILNDDHGAVFVAESEDGSVIGWIHVYYCPSLIVEKEAEIGGLVVDEKHRSQGIGASLIRKAEEWARAKGCYTIIVRANIIRHQAHEFYRALGFSEIKTQKMFRKVL